MARRKKNKQVFFEDVELIAGGGEGHSIAKINGKVVFVKYGAPGDVADIRIIGRKKKFSLAKIETLKTASDLRVESKCDHYGLCGGCRWQHLDYAAQLQLKNQWTLDCFERIGKVEVEEYLPILGAESIYQYRNKMEYSFCNKRWLYENENIEDLDHTNALGFHAPGRFDKIIDINQCWLQDDAGNKIRNFVRDFCLEHGYTFYDFREHHGLVRTLMLRNTRDNQWMINIIFAEQEEDKIEALLNAVNDEFKPYALNFAINEKLNDSIYDLEFKSYAGDFVIKERLMDMEFEISPKSFFQTNTIQAEKLYEVALDFADLQSTDVVYDLYCGTGTITCVAAAKAKNAIGVELVPEAIEAANRNARLNGINNVDFVVGDMRDVFNAEFYKEHGSPDVIITDPPRSGMHPKVVQYLLEIGCKKIVYISCNPATQARDLAELTSKYTIEKSRAVDMFPQTHHCENVVLLSLKEA